MERIIVGVVAIIAGSMAITLRKELVRRNIEFQNETFGFRFSKKANADIWLVAAIGLAFIIVGILILFGIFDLL